MTADSPIQILSDVDLALSGADPERSLLAFLEVMLDVFDCQRAYLAVPCDPDAPSFEVPFEATRPNWAGARALDGPIPIGPVEAAVLTAQCESEAPLVLDVSTLQSPEFAALRDAGVVPGESFSVKARIAVCVRPPIGPAWSFGLHFCEEEHIFSEAEAQLFAVVGRRIAAALSLWIVDQRLAKISGREALGLMVASATSDLSLLMERIIGGIATVEGGDAGAIAALRVDAELARRLVERISALGD